MFELYPPLEVHADFDLIYTRASAHREQRAFASMSFDTSESWNVAFSPNIEFGARLDIDETMRARPFASVGLTTTAQRHAGRRFR